MKKPSLLLILFCLSMAGLSGCVRYQPTAHLIQNAGDFPGISRVIVINQTREGTLSTMTKRALHEQISSRPGMILLAPGHDEGVTLTANLTSLRQSNVANAEVRAKEARDDDSDAYQTILYRITLQGTFTLMSPDGKKLLESKISANANVPQMHDHHVALQNGLKLATADFSRKILESITDWYASRALVNAHKPAQ